MESIQTLKSHPFFDDVDFGKVSHKKFNEIGPLLEGVLPKDVDFLGDYVPDKGKRWSQKLGQLLTRWVMVPKCS